MTAGLEQTPPALGSSGTQGWDAVCAIEVQGLNALLFSWFVGHHPGTLAATVRTGFATGARSFLLELTLGPPLLRFSPDQTLNVSRLVVSGALIEYDSTHDTVVEVTWLDPESSVLSADVSLTSVTGSLKGKSVALDLSDGNWVLATQGLDHDVQEALNAAVRAYYRSAAPVVPLCEVRPSTVGPFLQPTAFQLVTQVDPTDPTRGCLLIMMSTNQITNGKQPGILSPLAAYPIPKGSTAALLLSNAVIFNGLLPDQLTTSTNQRFAGRQDTTGAWSTEILSGKADINSLELEHAWTTNGYAGFWSGYPVAHVLVPLSGLTLQPTDGALTVSYRQSWVQLWAAGETDPPITTVVQHEVPTTVDFHSRATMHVDPVTCVVTFVWSGDVSAEMDLRGLDGLISDQSPVIAQRVKQQLEPVFDKLTVAEIETFALQNLFFPGQQLSLGGGSFPGDLHLTGTLVPTIVVSPDLVRLETGSAPVTFTASGVSPAAPLVWQLQPTVDPPRLGSLKVAGATVTYTPPPTLPGPTVVTLGVTDGPHSGGAVILLSPPGGPASTPVDSAPLTITSSPSLGSPIAPGATVTFSAAGPEGETPDDLRWVATPVGVGTMEANGATATYAAPAAHPAGTPLPSVRIHAYEVSRTGSALFGFVDLTLA